MITIILVLIITGVCLYLIETFVPLSPPIIIVIRVITVLFIVLFLLNAFGIYSLPVKIND